MIRALVVRAGGVLEVVKLENPDSGDEINKIIGGFFSSCFNAHGLIGFCDDTFLIEGRTDWSVVPEQGVLRSDVSPIAGPLVIVAHTQGGNARTMTDEELSRFRIDLGRGYIIDGVRVPILCYRITAEQHQRGA